MYASLDKVKLYLGINTTDDDALLTSLIARAQKIIESRTGRVFESSTQEVRYFDGILDVSDNGRILYLDKDLCAIDWIKNGDGTTLKSADYVTIPQSPPFYEIALLVSSGVVFMYQTDPERAISIRGNWAYSLTPPADIVHATIRLTAWLYRQKDTSADIDRPLITGDGVTIMPGHLPRDIIDILMYYRRW